MKKGVLELEVCVTREEATKIREAIKTIEKASDPSDHLTTIFADSSLNKPPKVRLLVFDAATNIRVVIRSWDGKMRSMGVHCGCN